MSISFVSPAERVSLAVAALAFLFLSHLVLAQGVLIQLLWLGVGLVLLSRLLLAAQPHAVPGQPKVTNTAKAISALQRRLRIAHQVREYELCN
jgi:hypothetical protein